MSMYFFQIITLCIAVHIFLRLLLVYHAKWRRHTEINARKCYVTARQIIISRTEKIIDRSR